jgi:hypothetical protein
VGPALGQGGEDSRVEENSGVEEKLGVEESWMDGVASGRTR